MNSRKFIFLIGVVLLNRGDSFANDPQEKTSAPARKSAQHALQTSATKFTTSEAEALAEFAKSLDQHGDVHRAAKAYAQQISSVQDNRAGRLTGQASVEPLREYRVGEAVTFNFHADFRAPKGLQYEWHWAAFEVTSDDRRCRLVTSGGGETAGKARLTVEVPGPSQMCGKYELFFVVFGRESGQRFGYLDSATIRYSVKPAP